MKHLYVYFFITSLFISQSSFALSIDELLGCYKTVNSASPTEYQIEKDHLTLDDGKQMAFPGQVIILAQGPKGGPFYKFPNNASSWTDIGTTSLQYLNIQPIIEGSSGDGFLTQVVSFAIDRNANLVLSYLQLYSTKEPSVQETHFSEILERVNCKW